MGDNALDQPRPLKFSPAPMPPSTGGSQNK